jgi:bifunctional non-homologous end joining protein LigD
MLLLQTDRLPDAADAWQYEIKLDGYRAIAFRVDSPAQLRSRNDSDFRPRYMAAAAGLDGLRRGTMVDGEVASQWIHDGRSNGNRLRP